MHGDLENSRWTERCYNLPEKWKQKMIQLPLSNRRGDDIRLEGAFWLQVAYTHIYIYVYVYVHNIYICMYIYIYMYYNV